jgi:hypothetical protein
MLQDGTTNIEELRHFQIMLGVIGPPTTNLKVGLSGPVTDMIDRWQ